jgi:hypothetical protein
MNSWTRINGISSTSPREKPGQNPVQDETKLGTSPCETRDISCTKPGAAFEKTGDKTRQTFGTKSMMLFVTRPGKNQGQKTGNIGTELGTKPIKIVALLFSLL